MIIVELKCPRCGKKQLFYSGDFEDSAYCECGYSHEAWFWPHRPVEALEYINGLSYVIGMTKFDERLSYTNEGDYPYWNDSLVMAYQEFIDKHPIWRSKIENV